MAGGGCMRRGGGVARGGGSSLRRSCGFGGGAGGGGRVRGMVAGRSRRGLWGDEPAGGGTGDAPCRLGQQRRTAEQAGQRAEHSAGGFSMHMNCGGAEAPEQLLPYLDRRQGISIQAGSVYRSVNAPSGN